QAMVVPAWSRAAVKTLGEIAPAQTFGVQIVGLNRNGARMLNPSADETLGVGDEVLTLGTPEQLREFKVWLRERPEEEAGDADENS
ncbi:MAG TPA: TrkA C-terminal domain-containing protein, partial [Opitutus sp.]|nr:TrkA C-terminal domain-containing protein [Opitutus sp.]